MRRITIEAEGSNENKVIEQVEKAARMAAKSGKGTYVICRTDEAQVQKTPSGPSVPSFISQGRRERMGVVW